MSSRYGIENNMLVISDPDLKIDIQVPFHVPLLPEDFIHEKKTATGESVHIEKLPDGALEKVFLKKGDVLHGEYRLYYPSGELLSVMFYHTNRLHGPSRFFARNNQLLSESWFNFGKREGILKQYYASGALASIQRFADGILQGKQEYLYENGMEKTAMEYRGGKLEGDVELFWPDGSPKRVVSFKDHKRHGWDQIWNDQGVLVDEGEFSKGEPIGTHTRRFKNGMVREEITYHTPKKTDRRYYDESGKILFEAVYSADGSYLEKTWNEDQKEYLERKGHWDGAKLCFP